MTAAAVQGRRKGGEGPIFTGLIEEKGTLRRLASDTAGAELSIAAEKVLSDLAVGDSIAVSGPCLTVTALERGGFRAFAMPETLRRTTLGSLPAGADLNLERAAALGGRLGGHLVTGHIDAVIPLVRRRVEGGALVLRFQAPREFLALVVTKGSVALDGVSLTVMESDSTGFSVGIIPHTAGETTLGGAEPGAHCNLEVDLIARYVSKLLGPYGKENFAPGDQGITMALLQEKGYI